MDFGASAGFLFKAVELVARLFSGFRRRKQEQLEEEILEHVAHSREWVSPRGLWAREYLAAVLHDLLFSAIFPPEDLQGWQKMKWDVRHFFLEARHRWRKFFSLVPERVVTQVMRRLWRQGLLERAAFDKKFYRLRR